MWNSELEPRLRTYRRGRWVRRLLGNYLRKLRARGQIAQLSVGALNPQGGSQLPTESEIAELVSSAPRYLELRARAQTVSLSDIVNPEIFRAGIPSADRKFIGGPLDPQAGGTLFMEAASLRQYCSALGGQVGDGARHTCANLGSPEVPRTKSSSLDCRSIGGGARSASCRRTVDGSREHEARLLSYGWGRSERRLATKYLRSLRARGQIIQLSVSARPPGCSRIVYAARLRASSRFELRLSHHRRPRPPLATLSDR